MVNNVTNFFIFPIVSESVFLLTLIPKQFENNSNFSESQHVEKLCSGIAFCSINFKLGHPKPVGKE